jgi:putative sigma-54 modulation protein
MKIIIQSLHFTASPELTEFVTDKVSKLLHLSDKIESANVCLKVDKGESGDDKLCEIRLAISGNDLFVKKHGESYEEAAIRAVDALEEQIAKMKSKDGHHTVREQG